MNRIKPELDLAHAFATLTTWPQLLRQVHHLLPYAGNCQQQLFGDCDHLNQNNNHDENDNTSIQECQPMLGTY